MTIRYLTTIDDLDAVLARAKSRPVLLFKHSTTCGVSAQAYAEMLALLQNPTWNAETWLVDVHAKRAVSTEIASRFKVRHASPQVLLVQDGIVLWHASHVRVTADAIQEALRRGPAPASAPGASVRMSWWRVVLTRMFG